MPKKFASVEERRAYWKQWYERNKHREDYKVADKATKKRIRKERKDWFLEYKKTLACEKCSIQDHRVLDFHHKDPLDKKDALANLSSHGKSKKTIMDEVNKCHVLCANCHRIVHWEEKNHEFNVNE